MQYRKGISVISSSEDSIWARKLVQTRGFLRLFKRAQPDALGNNFKGCKAHYYTLFCTFFSIFDERLGDILGSYCSGFLLMALFFKYFYLLNIFISVRQLDL